MEVQISNGWMGEIPETCLTSPVLVQLLAAVGNNEPNPSISTRDQAVAGAPPAAIMAADDEVEGQDNKN